MLHLLRGSRSAAGAVLTLSAEWAEWTEPGEGGAARHARAKVLGVAPLDLAKAALEARRAAGGSQRSCVVALCGDLVHVRVLPLPQVPRSDLKKVLLRKAAAFSGLAPEQTLFVARPSAAPAARGEGTPWLIAATSRALARDLTLHLRRERVEVRRLTPSRLARLSYARAARAGDSRACAVVDVEDASVAVSLLVGDALMLQSVLKGSFESVPTLALSLLQEIRSLDAWWRKSSRGEGLDRVVAIGLSAARAEPLAHALATALPQAQVDCAARSEATRIGEATDSAGATAGEASAPPAAGAEHEESLRACAADGPLTIDLSVPLPARYSDAALVAGCLIVLGAGSGVVVHGRLSSSVHALLGESRAFAESALDLERLREQAARTDALLSELAAEVERIRAAERLGIPVGECLSDALAAVAGRTALHSLALRADGGAVLGGRVDPDPLRSIRALEAAQVALEASRSFAEVELDPPTLRRVDSEQGAREILEFSIAAKLETAP